MKFVINLWFLLAILAFYNPQPKHQPLVDLPKLLFSGEKKIGEVVECREMQFRSSGGVGSMVNRYDIYDYLPVAITSQGIEGLGTHKLSKEWCERQIGKTVDIFVHPDDPSRSKISSYIQLWLLPVHVFIALLLVFLSIVKPKLWSYVPTPYFFGAFVFLVAELYF